MTHSRAQMLARIIIRVKLGIASLEEREKLLAWLDESEENRQLHKDIIRGKCIAERLRLEDEINETTDLTKLRTDLTSHISDYRNKVSETSKSLDSIKTSYKKCLDGAVSTQGFNGMIKQGQYTVASDAGTSKGNPYDAMCYGVLFVIINDGYTYNGENNWMWHIFINTSGEIFERHKINAGNWTSWIQFK